MFLVWLRKNKQWRSWLEAFFKVYLDHKESSLLCKKRKLGWFHTCNHSLWMSATTPGRGPTITEWRHQTVYRKYKKSKAARQDISVNEIDAPFIQPYSTFSLDILGLLRGFKMNHNNLFLQTKPGLICTRQVKLFICVRAETLRWISLLQGERRKLKQD